MFRQEVMNRLSSPEDLDEAMYVTSPRYWLGLVAVAVLLAAALIWAAFESHPVNVTADGLISPATANAKNLQAVVFVPTSKAGTVRQGMKAAVDVDTSGTGRTTAFNGVVSSVEPPINVSALVKVTGSTQDANNFPVQGTLIPIRLDLSSRSEGQPVELKKGQLCQAAITVDRQSLIQLVLP